MMLNRYTRKQWKALISATSLMVCFACLNGTIGYFVTPIAEELQISRTAFTLFYTIMWGISVLAAPAMGTFLMRVGVRKLLILGGCVGAVGFFAFSLCWQLWMFYAAGACLGLIQAGCTVLTAAVIINHSFGGKSGTPMAVAAAGGNIFGICVGLILPQMINAIGWRGAYRFLGCCWCALFVLAVFMADREKPFAAQVQREKAGAGEAPGTGSKQLCLFIAAMVMANVVSMFMHHLPAFYVEMGSSALLSGRLMSVVHLAAIISKLITGALFDKKGPVAAAGYVLLPFSAAFPVMLLGGTVGLSFGSVLLAFGITSLTFLQPLLTRAIFGQNEFARVNSLCTIGCNLGIAIGSPIWSAVFDISGTYRYGVVAAPLLTVTAFSILYCLIRRVRRFLA